MHCKVGHLSAQNNIDICISSDDGHMDTDPEATTFPARSFSSLFSIACNCSTCFKWLYAALIAWSSQLCWAIIIRTSHALHTNAFHSFDHVQRIINNNNNKTTTMATFEKISTEPAIHPSISHLRLLVFLGPTFVPLQQSHKRPSQRTSISAGGRGTWWWLILILSLFPPLTHLN